MQSSAAPQTYSLSGTGPAMACWMHGFCAELQRSGLRDDTVFAGASGGAFAATLLAAGIDQSWDSEYVQCLMENVEKYERLRNPILKSERTEKSKESEGTFTIKDALMHTLASTLPDDVAARVSGKLQVAVVDASGPMSSWYTKSPVLIRDFADKQDLMSTLAASSHIPYTMDGKAKAVFRGEEYIDGSLSGQLFPYLPGAMNVCVYPTKEYCTTEHMPAQGMLSVYLARMVSGWMNKQQVPVHAHPFLLPSFQNSTADFTAGVVPREIHHERYREGCQAFHLWDRSQGCEETR